mgnify:CR=1 FL=1
MKNGLPGRDPRQALSFRNTKRVDGSVELVADADFQRVDIDVDIRSKVDAGNGDAGDADAEIMRLAAEFDVIVFNASEQILRDGMLDAKTDNPSDVGLFAFDFDQPDDVVGDVGLDVAPGDSREAVDHRAIHGMAEATDDRADIVDLALAVQDDETGRIAIDAGCRPCSFDSKNRMADVALVASLHTIHGPPPVVFRRK